MKHFPVLILACVCLSECTLLQPEKTLVSGSVWLVSQADVHQAVAAARGADSHLAPLPVIKVTVDSRSKLYIYFQTSAGSLYAVVVRADGGWHYVSTEDEIICG